MTNWRLSVALFATLLLGAQGIRTRPEESARQRVGGRRDGSSSWDGITDAACDGQDEICNLPGFQGPLPVRMRSGYITVDEDDGRRLFYVVVDHQRTAAAASGAQAQGRAASDPTGSGSSSNSSSRAGATAAPVILWLTGGPGCSSLDAFIYEHGPFRFSYADAGQHEQQQQRPVQLTPNPYAWSMVATVIYVDSPAGTGMSYSTSVKPGDDYLTDDVGTIQDLGVFMEGLWERHPDLADKELYIAGESYSGVFVPMLAEELLRRNQLASESSYEPLFNLKGYVVGNPVTEEAIDGNAQYEFAAAMGYIDPDTWREVRHVCNDNFWNATYGSDCWEALADVKYGLRDLNWYSVLDACTTPPPEPESAKRTDKAAARSLAVAAAGSAAAAAAAAGDVRVARMQWPWAVRMRAEAQLNGARHVPLSLAHVVPCADRILALDWLNRPEVRAALHAASASEAGTWAPCSDVLRYRLVDVALARTHARLVKAGLRALVYSGDHDMVVPHTGTRQWVFAMPHHHDPREPFSPWTINGQIAGFTVRFRSGLQYATVKGAGHMVPSSSPSTALEMLTRFLEDTL